MAWTTLRAAVADAIATNGNQKITGQVLQNVLNNIIRSVGENAAFAGIATPTTNPGNPDGPVFYFASESGEYANFGHVVQDNEFVVLSWSGIKWSATRVLDLTKIVSAVSRTMRYYSITNADLTVGSSIAPDGTVVGQSPQVKYTPGYFRVSDYAYGNMIRLAERGFENKIVACNLALYDENKSFVTRLAYTDAKEFDISEYPTAEYFRVLIVYRTQDGADVLSDYIDGDVILTSAEITPGVVSAIIPRMTSGYNHSYSYPIVSGDILDLTEDSVLVYNGGSIVAKDDISNYRSISLLNPNTASSANIIVYNKEAKKCYAKKYDNPIGYAEIVLGGVRNLKNGAIAADFPFSVVRDTDPLAMPTVALGAQTTRAYALIGWVEERLLYKISVPNSIYRYAVQGFSEDKGVTAVTSFDFDSSWMSGNSAYQYKWGAGRYKWVRIVFARVDNADMTRSDIDVINAIVSAELYSGSGVVAMTAEECAENYAVEHSGKRYSGERITLGGYPFRCDSHLKMQDSNYYFQGAAMFDRYFFQFHTDNAEIEVYDVESKTLVQKLTLTPGNNHAGSGGFGVERVSSTDVFPVLYISSMDENKVYAYRITGTSGNYAMKLTQTISLPQGSSLMYLPNCAIDTKNNELILFGYSKNSWSVSSGNESIIARYELPKLADGDVSLEASQALDVFRLPFIYAEQGACASAGRLYLSYGNTATKGGLLQIDLQKKAIISTLDFSFLGEVEPEGVGIYDNYMWVSFQKPNQTIYKLSF